MKKILFNIALTFIFIMIFNVIRLNYTSFDLTKEAAQEEVYEKEDLKESVLDKNNEEREEEVTVFNGDERIGKDSVIPKTLGKVPGGIYLTVEAKIHDGEEAEVLLDNKIYEMEQVENKEYLKGKQTQFAKFRAFIKIDKREKTERLGQLVVKLKNGKQIVSGGEIVVIGEEEKLDKNILIKEYSSKLYSGEDTTYVPLENVSSIPKDTVLKATYKISMDDKEYYLLESGYRIKKEDGIEVDKILSKDDKNEIKKIEILEDEKFTTLKIKEKFKGEYNLYFSENFYKDYKNKNFNVESKGEKKAYLKFTDGNLKKIKRLEGDEDSIIKEIFKCDKDTLCITLDKDIYGHYGFYDECGDLNIKFRKKLTSLKGAKIIIDPGHGLSSKGYLDSGALGYHGVTEHMLNVNIAKELEESLKAEGAEAVRLNTTEKVYSLKDRPNKSFVEDGDLFISIHHNSGGKKLNAVEVYYSTSFSKEFGLSVNKSLVEVYNKKLFKDGKDYDRGTKWDYFTVLLEKYNPSILVEVGYIDNLEAFYKLNDKKNVKFLADGIKNGIKTYVSGNNL